jgi:hypothetical protein
MQIKINQATNNRPEGDRIIDAPAVLVNIQHYIEQLKEEDAWQKRDRNAITVFKTAGVTVVINALHSCAEMRDIEIEGMLMLQVVEGEITIKSDEGERKLTEQQVLILHPCFKTNIIAEKDTVLILSNIQVGDQRVKDPEAIL